MQSETRGAVRRVDGPIYLPHATVVEARRLQLKAERQQKTLPFHAALAVVLDWQERTSEKRSGRVQIARDVAAIIEQRKGNKTFTEVVNDLLRKALSDGA